MKIQDITNFLESVAPLSLQENYDNAGLLTGNGSWECTGVITALDTTIEVVLEAIDQKCNLIVAHHPIIFNGLKKMNGNNYIERAIIAAIKNDIAIYAIHTNLDNIATGVNAKIADKIGLVKRAILAPKKQLLKKLVTFVPQQHTDSVRQALFNAGAGSIGKYSECSFNIAGSGTFKAGEGTNPHVGEVGLRHNEAETRIEVIFPEWLEKTIYNALIQAHPYEEVAYDIYNLDNVYQEVGSGMIGMLEQELPETEFLALLKDNFDLKMVRHTRLCGKPVKKVALCGGAGSFLLKSALGAGADFFVSADFKYHEFFEANDRIVIADIGHYESEQFTVDLLFDILREKFLNFAVQKTRIKTNPVYYFA